MGSAGDAMEASGGRTGRFGWGEALCLRDARDARPSLFTGSEADFDEEEARWSSGVGEALRTLEEEGVAEKDCSKGLGSRSKSLRVWRVTILRSGERERLFLDMGRMTMGIQDKMTTADVARYIAHHCLTVFTSLNTRPPN